MMKRMADELRLSKIYYGQIHGIEIKLVINQEGSLL